MGWTQRLARSPHGLFVYHSRLPGATGPNPAHNLGHTPDHTPAHNPAHTPSHTPGLNPPPTCIGLRVALCMRRTPSMTLLFSYPKHDSTVPQA